MKYFLQVKYPSILNTKKFQSTIEKMIKAGVTFAEVQIEFHFSCTNSIAESMVDDIRVLWNKTAFNLSL